MANLIAGMGVKEAAEKAGIWRERVWSWRAKRDPEFCKLLEDAQLSLVQEIVDDGVQMALAQLRSLAPEAVQALRDGVRSDVRYQLAKKTIRYVNDHGNPVEEETYEPVALPDRSLAVQAADRALKRIQEFATTQQVELSGSLEARLADLDDGPSD